MGRSRWSPAAVTVRAVWGLARARRALVVLGGVVSAAGALGATSVPAAAQEPYARATEGTRSFDLGRIAVRVLVEESNLGGGEVEIAELTFPAGTRGGEHRHGRVEIIYVLSGVMEHIVNGEPHELRPGMVGIVRPEDTVAHRVLSDEPVRTLVIWAPGGELERIAPRRPPEPSDPEC